MRTSAIGLCFIAVCAFAPGSTRPASPASSCELSGARPPDTPFAPVEIVRDRDEP